VSSVPGPSSCVKGPCGAHPNVKQIHAPSTSKKYSHAKYSEQADAVYRLPRVVINMAGRCELTLCIRAESAWLQRLKSKFNKLV